jgi:hypothetical protein
MADYMTLLRDHVTLKCRSIDRIFLQAYVPKLQSVGQVCSFLRWQRGFKIPSSAAFGKIGDEYVKSVHQFAEKHKIPLVHFKKGENKEEAVRPYLEAAAREGKGRVVLIGIAQEKASAWRSWKRKGHENRSHPHMEWGRQMAYVNHFYFYIWDEDWGATFWKTNAYAPFPIWIWLNGHEWAKRQLVKIGVRYESLDNGFRSCENPATLQKICDRLGPGAVKSFLWRWLRQLPCPFTQSDFKAGYVYELAFRQFEVSETCVFDRPQAGRMWFEGVIRDHLDVGRPDQIALVFDRRVGARTPGTFRTRVLTPGVDPTLCCYYRSSRIKQYFKEGRALRTETVICDTRDFGIGRRVCTKNWHAMRAVGEAANRRLCEAETADARPAPDVVTFQKVTRPSMTSDGLYSPGLRFGDARVMAVFASVVGFCHVATGFTNGELVKQVLALGQEQYDRRKATYDLRRLKRKGLISRIPKSRRYQLTVLGRSVAVLFTKTHDRVLAPGLAALDLRLPDSVARRSALATTWRSFERALEQHVQNAMVAA